MKWMFALALLCLPLLSCNQDEMDDLAKAQKCLDQVPQTQPTSAEACLRYVEKYDSQQANILKCSIYMTAGGLVESKIVRAYKASEDKTITNKTAAFMGILALDRPDVSKGYEKAVEADKYCQKSLVPGLQYISGAIKIGSFMAKTIGTSVNFDDTAAVTAAVDSLINDCNSDPRGPSCPADISEMGSTAVVLADSYCASEKADDKVCTDINSAVDATNGDPTAVGNALMCYLGKKKYDAQTGKCTS